MRFEKGESYFAVPCLEGAAKKLVTMVGRRGRTILFTDARLMETTWVDNFDGKEVARLRDADGLDYTVSPASQVDAALVSDVAQAMRLRPPAKLPTGARRGIFFKFGDPIC